MGGNNRRFTSYDRSTTTKLDYAVNRSYNAGLGRFTQVDPIGMGAASLGDPQSLNLYAYCQNDPINHVDPDGLEGSGNGNVVVVVVLAVLGAIRAIFGGGGSGSRARTAPIVKKVTFRENSSSTTHTIWTQAAIQAGAGAVSSFISDKKVKEQKQEQDPWGIRRAYYLSIACLPKVIAAMNKAWARTSNGIKGTEAGFVLNGNPKDPSIVETASGNTQGADTLKGVRKGETFAYVHVHPNSSTMYPSTPQNNSKGSTDAGDTLHADGLGALAYVIHRNGMTVYDPKYKDKPMVLRRNIDWSTPCRQGMK